MKSINKYINPLASCEEALYELLVSLNVSATYTNIQSELTEHPDYPSLLSISDVLKNYQVDNIAAKVNFTQFNELPLPFIAHVKDRERRQEYFAVVFSSLQSY